MRAELMADATRIVREAETMGATRFYALVSGGKDSITAAHVVNSIRPVDGVLFIDTTVGLAETRRFVEAFCRERGWPLTILQPAMTYDAIVAKYGFPGPSMHRYTYIYLKWKPLAAWVRAHPDRKHLALISGLRRTESKRRGRTVGEAVERDRSCKDMLFVAPLSNWPTEDVWSYLRAHDLPVSPAYEALHLSGDCLCGAFAQRDERSLITTFYPELAARISALEASCARPYNTWGHGAQRCNRNKRLFACADCQAR